MFDTESIGGACATRVDSFRTRVAINRTIFDRKPGSPVVQLVTSKLSNVGT